MEIPEEDIQTYLTHRHTHSIYVDKNVIIVSRAEQGVKEKQIVVKRRERRRKRTTGIAGEGVSGKVIKTLKGNKGHWRSEKKVK